MKDDLKKYWWILALFIIGVPLVVEILLLVLPGAGTDDGWLGFWGGYLGAGLTLGGVYVQLNFQREEIKLDKIIRIQEKSLAELAELFSVYDKYFNTYFPYYKELRKVCDYYDITSSRLINYDENTESKLEASGSDFIKNVHSLVSQDRAKGEDYYKPVFKEENFVNNYQDVMKNIDLFKIKYLAALPFNESSRCFPCFSTGKNTLEAMKKNIKTLFKYVELIRILDTMYDNYWFVLDGEGKREAEQDLLSNLRMRDNGNDNIIGTIEEGDIELMEDNHQALLDDKDKLVVLFLNNNETKAL